MKTHQERFQWDDARVFLAIARAGTLTDAANAMGDGIATISRRIKRLEDALQVPLFMHHQTGYRMTDEGRALLPKAEALERAAQLLTVEANVDTPAGLVRLATAENLATCIIIPSLPALLAQHPELVLEVLTGLNTVNLHRNDADLALRLVKPKTGNVTSRKLGTLGFGLYASEVYVASRSGGRTGEDFSKDGFIGWTESSRHFPAALWIERALMGRRAVLSTTTLRAQVSAAKAGLGIAVLPHFLAQEAQLIGLSTSPGVDQPIWLSIQADLASSRRVRVVADYVSGVIQEQHDRLAHGRVAR
jgi:DNA-binding transcriptional LysR family regulator